MKWHSVFGVVTVLTMSLTAQGRAQQGGGGGTGMGVGVLVGATVPTGSYSDVAKVGWHAGGFLSFGMRESPFGFRLEGMYHGFGTKNAVTSGGGATQITLSNDFSMVTGTANVVFGIPLEASPIRPYLIGGLGAYYLKNSPSCAAGNCSGFSFGSTSTTKFGLNGGAGLEFGLAGLSAFAEARYHYVFNAASDANCIGQSGCGKSAVQMVPISFGLLFRF